MSATSIEWATDTWNPLRARRLSDGKVGWHCEKVSAGCASCYAETFNGRRLPAGGTGIPYNQRSRAQVETYLDGDVLLEPIRWKKPRRVFVASMTDVFGDWVPDVALDQLFAAMALAPAHEFLLLTKRSERMRRYFSTARTKLGRSHEVIIRANTRMLGGAGVWPGWPLPNVWLGVSVEDQKTADQRIPDLLATPAAVHWVSYEPALDEVEFQRGRGWLEPFKDTDASLTRTPRLSWIVVGGESGARARPFDVAWARSTIAQCKAAGTACFVKQVGSWPVDGECARCNGTGEMAAGIVCDLPRLRCPACDGAGKERQDTVDRKGGDMETWPGSLRVREFPAGRGDR